MLGAPLYMFHWHGTVKPLRSGQWPFFALGPIHAEEKEFQEARKQLEKELAKFPWLTPRAIATKGGKFDPQKFTFPYNLMPSMSLRIIGKSPNWLLPSANARKATPIPLFLNMHSLSVSVTIS